jgi:hypothetical protein
MIDYSLFFSHLNKEEVKDFEGKKAVAFFGRIALKLNVSPAAFENEKIILFDEHFPVLVAFHR